MHFYSVLSSTLLAAAAVSAKTINIKVGQSGLTFSPNSTTAEVGDQVVFTFYPANHNVVQATFADPCQPMAGGFYSGFQSTMSGPAPMSFELTVNSTTPIWYYCGQGKHCESGMVGVINVAKTGNKTLEAFAEAAAKVSASKNPTVAAGTGGKLVAASAANSSSSGSGTSTGSSSGSTSTSSASSLEKGSIMALFAAIAVTAVWAL